MKYFGPAVGKRTRSISPKSKMLHISVMQNLREKLGKVFAYLYSDADLNKTKLIMLPRLHKDVPAVSGSVEMCEAGKLK